MHTPQDEIGALVELIELLEQVDLSHEQAEINQISMSDNNGSRIIL